MSTWIILGLLLAAVFFALRYTLRKAKNGECVGCSGCKGREKGAQECPCRPTQDKR